MTSFGTELHYSDKSPQSVLLCFSVPGPISFHLFSPWYHAHILPVSLPTLPLCHPGRSFSQGYIHASSIANLPLFFLPPLPATSSAVRAVRDPVSKAPSLLSDRPQSQSLPLSGAEVYTHGKLIPVPCLPHIVLMSKVVRCGVTFSKDRHTVGSHYTRKQHIERERWRAADLMKRETKRKGERKRIKQAG